MYLDTPSKESPDSTSQITKTNTICFTGTSRVSIPLYLVDKSSFNNFIRLVIYKGNFELIELWKVK